MFKLKKSRYNFLFNTEIDTLLYNGLTNNLISFKNRKALVNILDFPNKHSIDNSMLELKQKLIEYDYLIPDSFDEIEHQRKGYNSVRQNNKNMTMILAPTLDCNFRCSYCFEDLQKAYMSKEIVDAIKKFTLNKIKSGVTHLKVNWYGGEPLLSKNIIYELSEVFNSVNYESILYTNGYLLDEKFILNIPKLKINMIYTTIDGQKEIHDTRRFLNGGKPTFDKIKKNIENLVKANIPNLKIVIRINFDTQNINSFESLIDEFKSMSGRIRITFARTGAGRGAGKDYTGCFDIDTYKKQTNTFTDLLNKGKFAVRKLPEQINCACYADTTNSFAIDALGNVYKCIDGIGRQKGEIGKLTKHGNINYNHAELDKWKTFDIFENLECLNCKYLPICMGKCTLQQIDKLGQINGNEKPGCYFKSHGFGLEDRVVQFYYGK